MASILPYSDKRKQLLKMTILVNEQNVSVMYIDINTISLYLGLNIFQQDECSCSKLGVEVEYAKSNLKTSLSQIWLICQLLPFVRVGQYKHSKGAFLLSWLACTSLRFVEAAFIEFLLFVFISFKKIVMKHSIPLWNIIAYHDETWLLHLGFDLI